MIHPDSLTARFARFSWGRFVRHIPVGKLGAAKDHALARLKQGAKREERDPYSECHDEDTAAMQALALAIIGAFAGVLCILFIAVVDFPRI